MLIHNQYWWPQKQLHSMMIKRMATIIAKEDWKIWFFRVWSFVHWICYWITRWSTYRNLPCNFFSVSQYFCNSVKYLSSMNTFDRPNVAMIWENAQIYTRDSIRNIKCGIEIRKTYFALWIYSYLVFCDSHTQARAHTHIHVAHDTVHLGIKHIVVALIVSSAPKVAQ